MFCGNHFIGFLGAGSGCILIRFRAGAVEAFRGAWIPVDVDPDSGDITDNHVWLDPEVLLQGQFLGGNSIAYEKGTEEDTTRTRGPKSIGQEHTSNFKKRNKKGKNKLLLNFHPVATAWLALWCSHPPTF